MERNTGNIEKEFDSILADLEVEGVSGNKLVDEISKRYIEKKVMSSGKPIPTFLKPVFLQEDLISEIRNITVKMMDCLEKVTNLFFESEDYHYFFEVSEAEKLLASVQPGYPRRIQHARLDAFINGNDIKFCEFNCDTPGGPGYSDIQTELLLETPAMKRISDGYDLKPDRFMPGVLDSLTSSYEHFTGKPVTTLPPFAIITVFDMDPTTEELFLMAEWFREQGCDVEVAEPKDCSFEKGVFRVKNKPIELVYRRGTTQWWITEKQYGPIWEAYRAGSICLVNPLNSKLAGKKSLMAVLQSGEMSPRLTEEEREIIEKHIPWTRVVRKGKTDYRGEELDMTGFIIENRKNLVLKPIGLYGGKGVVVGKEVDDREWKEALRKALESTHVVQEYIDIPEIAMPVYDNGLHFVDKKVNINFFAFNGKYSGAMARVSDSSVINVSAGGGLVPIIPYSEK